MLNDLKDVSVTDLLKIHNRIVSVSKLDVKKPKRFASRTDAEKRLTKVLQDSGEGIIRVLKPDYVKRGVAADRWDILDDLQIVSQYITLCEDNGHRRSDAVRDLRYNQEHGLITVIRG